MKLAASLQAIPSGKAGIIHTLKLMRRLVRESKKQLSIRLAALSIVKNLQQKDFGSEIDEIFFFVRDRIRYTRDINGVETVQYPQITLELKQGDCDDKSVLLASLLETIGHKTRFKAVGMFKGKFSHVFVQVFYDYKWLSLDPTMNKPPGWEPENSVDSITLLN